MWCAAQLNQRMIFQIHAWSKTNIQIQKNNYQNCVSGTSGCWEHVGVGDMRVSGTCGCWGHVGVGDKWVSGTCAGGPVGVRDMWVWGTCGCGGHVGVGDMWV